MATEVLSTSADGLDSNNFDNTVNSSVDNNVDHSNTLNGSFVDDNANVEAGDQLYKRKIKNLAGIQL